MTTATNQYIKISADGKVAAADVTDHVAVLDRFPQRDGTHLLWSAATNSAKAQAWSSANKTAQAVDLLGLTGWRLPTVDELFGLADRSRCSPAIDTALFPGTKSDWYWASSAWANSPKAYAWIVSFGNGSADSSHRDYKCFVRAVRSVSPGQLLDMGIDLSCELQS